MEKLTRDLRELRAFVDSIEPVNALLRTQPTGPIHEYLQVRRRFDEAAFLIALYATFEMCIEDVVASLADLDARRVSYRELPGKLITKHRTKSAELLERRLGEGRYANLTELDVVRNLFACLNGDRPYTLNRAAIVAHDLNFRVAEINALFATIGIEGVCHAARRNQHLRDWYREAAGPDHAVPSTAVDERIDELVERRNQIAHRGAPDELLGVGTMGDLLDFFDAFLRSLFAVAVGHYLEHNKVQSPGSILLEPIDFYEKGTVVVVARPLQRVFVGQPIFALGTGPDAAWGRIQSLRVDDNSLDELIPTETAPNGVGVGLDFRCPKNSQLIALTADDDVVWSPLERRKEL